MKVESKIICGDALKTMRGFPPSSFDLIIFSPPYNLGNTSGGGLNQYKAHYDSAGGMKVRGGSSKWKNAALANGYDGYNDKLPHEKYVAWQKEILSECWRLLSDTGAIFYNHKQRVLNGVCVTPLDYNPNLPIRQIITWARSGGINFSTCFYLPTSEWIVIFAKPDFRLKNKGASGLGDVWNFSQEMNNSHPAPFPLELPRRILESCGGFRVLDPFCGSATTGVACVEYEREFTGIELSAHWAEYGRRRIMRAQGIGVDLPQRMTSDKPMPLFDISNSHS